MLLTPQKIEEAATEIVEFWETSKLPDADKEKILKMTKDYYEDSNQHIFEQYLANLCERTINRRVPETDFERDD
jgi:hypothetical protein